MLTVVNLLWSRANRYFYDLSPLHRQALSFQIVLNLIVCFSKLQNSENTMLLETETISEHNEFWRSQRSWNKISFGSSTVQLVCILATYKMAAIIHCLTLNLSNFMILILEGFGELQNLPSLEKWLWKTLVLKNEDYFVRIEFLELNSC